MNMSTMRHYRRFLLLLAMLSAATFEMAQTDWDRYLGMTAVMTQVPVPTAILSNVILLFIQI